jgi:tetratricopeptide (TPR) repeat protein
MAQPLANERPPVTTAEQLYWTGHYSEALEQLDALGDHPPLLATITIARCHIATGKYTEAHQRLTRALQEIEPDREAVEPPHPDVPTANLHAAAQAELARIAWLTGNYAELQLLVDTILKSHPNQLAARWWQAELWRVHGKLDEALAGYEWFVDYYNDLPAADANMRLTAEDLHYIGLAAAQYARWTRNHAQFSFLVNKLYPSALRAQPDYWPVRVESALLFLEKYNQPDAQVDIDRGLAINPQAAELYVARARLALQDFQLDRVDAAIDQALQINPQLVAAWQIRADAEIIRERFDAAEESLAKAALINPHDEATLGRQAALFGYLDGWKLDQVPPRMSEIIQRVEATNPRCGDFFVTLSDTMDHLQKYSTAQFYYREALQRMPQLTDVHGKLGLVAMRLGEEADARQLLRASFEIDPFNIRVKNSMEVLRVIDEYAVLETEHFILRFNSGTDRLFAECVAEYLEEVAYPEITTALEYEPPQKSLFEIFSTSHNAAGQNWFSARLVGLPFIGVIAACGGKMVGMVTPSELPMRVNWADTLKHEFVHVVNLQQTDFHIPHWYTEGLAVWHERKPRPIKWQRLLAKRLRQNTLFNLSNINMGFLRPGNQDDWQLAYCQSELYVEFFIAEFGPDAPQKLLDAYSASKTTDEAIADVFQTTTESLEAKYRKHLEALCATIPVADPWRDMSDEALDAALAQEPDRAEFLAERAIRAVDASDLATARQYLQRAAASNSKLGVVDFARAKVELAQGNAQSAREALNRSIAATSTDDRAWWLMATLMLKHDEPEKCIEFGRQGMQQFPDEVAWAKYLASLYLKTNDLEALESVLQEIVRIDPENPTILKKLAQISVQRGDGDAAVRWATSAVHIDCWDPMAHTLLGHGHQARHDHARAILSLERALRLDAAVTNTRFLLAQSRHAVGENVDAKRELERILEAQPDHEPARQLLQQLNLQSPAPASQD